MLDYGVVVAFLALIVPIMFTPGPVNLACSAIAARNGTRAVLPFLLGVNLVNLGFCLLAAFGVGELLTRYPDALRGIRVAGAGFILFLAYKFYASASDRIKLGRGGFLSFRDGLLLNALNVKSMLVFSLAFGQFADPSLPLAPQLWRLGAGLFLLCFTTQAAWTAAGAVLGRVAKDRQKEIAYASSALLVGVAVWFAAQG